MTAVLPALQQDADSKRAKVYKMFGLDCVHCGHAMLEWWMWPTFGAVRHVVDELKPCRVGVRG